jgi:hypothetical protein
MRTHNRTITAAHVVVVGTIRQTNRVVVGVVAGMPRYALGLADDARYLLARLFRLTGAGRLAMQPCQAKPVARRASQRLEHASSGHCLAQRRPRLTRPWSAPGMFEF